MPVKLLQDDGCITGGICLTVIFSHIFQHLMLKEHKGTKTGFSSPVTAVL